MATETEATEEAIRGSDVGRAILSSDEAIAALVAGYPISCSAEEGWNTSPVRRPESERQVPHHLRLCYDYTHAIKHWEIDE